MKLKELLSWDSQLGLVREQKGDCDVTALIPLKARDLKPSGLAFVKDKVFLETALKLAENQAVQKIALVIDKTLLEKFPEEVERIESSYMAVMSSAHVGLSIARLSRPFYEAQLEQVNDLVDGRQMGTAQVSPMADIAQNVFLGNNVVVKAGAKIHSGARILSNSFVGEDCEIFPCVTVYPFTQLGQRVRLHSGSVIGSDGFGYEFHDGAHHKIWHVGGVDIGDDVEIGAASCVDRGTMGMTRIGAGTKIDNHVQIGHNCQVGRAVIICGQSGLSGSAEVGDYSVLGGKVGVGPGVIIGKASQIAGSAMVAQGKWDDGAKLGGHPARPYKEWMKGLAYIRRQSLK